MLGEYQRAIGSADAIKDSVCAEGQGDGDRPTVVTKNRKKAAREESLQLVQG